MSDAGEQVWSSSPIIWYRPSIRRLVWRLWGFACLWLLLGATCLGALRVMGVDFGSAWLPLYALGLALITAAPWQLLVGLQRAVKIERVLSVHEEGVRWQDGAFVAHVTWSNLDAVEVSEAHIALVDGDRRVELPAELDGITAPSLAAMLIDMRRRSLLGLPVRLAIPDRT